MNKSDITNLLTVLITAYGYSNQNETILFIGIFALSGSITNTLAIHMLFEKVPYLYGSGIIENKFEEFKNSIHNLIMEQFFTKDNLRRFFKDELESTKDVIDFKNIMDNTDLNPAFESLKQTVMASSFGGMLGMFGGETALEPLKEPFIDKFKDSIVDISKSKEFQESLNKSIKTNDLSDDIYIKLSEIVNKRLDELTPKMVKHIIQNVIKEHLGWLVIWGAVFGGLIGFISSLL